MPDSLADLEARRAAVQSQIAQLGDMRSGSIGSRLRQSGMFWTVRGPNAIIGLRCCHFNGRVEDYWAPRPAA